MNQDERYIVFDRNQKEFTSPRQREVWAWGIHIVPLDISLADITDEETRLACTQIYYCIMEILTDMYEHAEDYIYNPRWYTGDYLVWLICGNEPMKKHAEEYHRYLRKIPKYGFVYDQENDTWCNERYPLLFEYFPRMAMLYSERKKNLGGYLERLDFRLFAPKIKLTLEDLLHPLTDSEREICMALHEFAILKGYKLEKKDPYTFRYIYKKLYSMEIRNNPFSVSVAYRLDNGRPAYAHAQEHLNLFLDIVQAQPDCQEINTFILNGISVCNACSGQKSASQRCGIWIELDGKRRLAARCHLAIGIRRTKNKCTYTAYDAQMIMRLLEIRQEQIDRYLGIS